MPTDACIYFYDCHGCGTLLKPKPGIAACFARMDPSLPADPSELIMLHEASYGMSPATDIPAQTAASKEPI